MASPRLTARLRSLQQREAEFRSENGTTDVRTKTTENKDYNSELKSRTRDPDLYRDFISRRAASEREKDNKSATTEQKLSSDNHKTDYHKDYNNISSNNKDYSKSTREYTSSPVKDKDTNISSRISSTRDSNIRDNATVKKDISTTSKDSSSVIQKDYNSSHSKELSSYSTQDKAGFTKDYHSSSKVVSDKDCDKDCRTSTFSDRTSLQKDYTYTAPGIRSNGLHAEDNMKASEEDDEFVGFATLPDQVHRKAVKRGFDFTLMVVGESGLGKSTLVNSLFLTDLYKERKLPSVQDNVERTVNIDKKYMEFEERGVKLRLTIVDTPGFTDAVNGEESWKTIEQYITNQFNQYYDDESGVNRKNIQDNRVHCCLYFVSPFGHGLRQVDIEFMKKLHEKVNIVPVIAKADTLMPKEMAKIKAKVLEEIEENKIKIYEFPDCDSDEDEDFKKQDSQLKSSVPFAVIGSNAVVEVNGRRVRGRLYPWGIVEVDNPQHCDFTKLRQMLISTHMQDLKDVTRDVHYENFRARRVAEQLTKQQLRERNKLKRDSSPSFESIMDTDKLLEQKDEEIRRMQEMLLKMQQQLGGAQRNGHVGVSAS